MLFILSPSKTLDFTSDRPLPKGSSPVFLKESELLIKALRRYSARQLCELMHISDKLAALNRQRYRDFRTPFTDANARPALLAFTGDVYEGMQVENYGKKEFAYAERHLRILSGLYGLLRPLDLIQPYRLEMGTALPTRRGKNLVGFWGGRITEALNHLLEQEKKPLLVNLASKEYFDSVRAPSLKARLLTIHFKDYRDGSYKIVGLFAKKARGWMADYAIAGQIADVEELKSFTRGGYQFNPRLSTESDWVFTRKL